MSCSWRAAAAFTSLLLWIGGCGSMRPPASSIRARSFQSMAVDTSRGDRAAGRMREAIGSLRADAGRPPSGARDPLAPPAPLPPLPPLPLIQRGAHDRMVGTAGAWTVVQTPQRLPDEVGASASTSSAAARSRSARYKAALSAVLAAVVVGGLLGWRARRGRLTHS